MEILYKIIGIALITCLGTLLIKPTKPDFATIISIVGGIIILLLVLNYLSTIFDTFNSIIEKTGVNKSVFTIILKIVGIGYLTEFTASMCNDTGNGSLGDKVLVGGKLIIMVMALPIVTSILEIIMELIPTWKEYYL